MEKKSTRSVQSSTKGATDTKKIQDASKLWPRSSKRREPSGGTPSKNERKPPPQRFKVSDKRPRSRGVYNVGIGSMGGKEDTRLELDDDAELGSVFTQGGKKQSLNHLLNFHFEPRDRQGRARGNKNLTYKHKYNKEQFLQANCQFVVKESGEYKLYLNNPDALVDWDCIEQVNVHVSEFPSCPICLYPPVAAKITRCGHIYCWSCMLHYLALADKTRNCPICFESVKEHDLKSVTAIPHSSYNVNEDIEFHLMKRVRGSLTAYPFDHDIKEEGTIFHISDTHLDGIYSKLLLANSLDVSRILQRERKELEMIDEDDPERCFINQALSLIHKRENQLAETTVLEETENVESIANLHISDKVFYFYQACDGQHIYLHPINVRMLENTYGTLEFCPKVITGRILEKEGGSMTDDIRKRLRYLQHLPITCQFEVAEIHMKTPLISDETCKLFHDQLEGRKRRRQKRARDEKKREKKIAEVECKLLGKYPTASLHLESHSQFPQFNLEDVEEASFVPPSNITTPVGSLTSEQEYGGLSFAKMLQTPSKPSQRKTHAEATTSKITPTRLTSESEQDDDHVVVPAFNQSFRDAVAIALEKAALTNDSNGEGQSLGKKKKNKQKRILFSTSMAYSEK